MSLDLERRMYYERNPVEYFSDYDGSKQRWRGYLDKKLDFYGTRELRVFTDESKELYVRFVRRDIKHHKPNIKRSSTHRGMNVRTRISQVDK